MPKNAIYAIAASKTPASLWRASVRAFRQEGFVAGSYDMIRGTNYTPVMRSVSFGYDDDIVNSYHSMDYTRLDVAARRSIATGAVMTWDEAWGKGPITLEERQFRELLTLPKTFNALAVPCFGPCQRIGYVSLLPSDEGRIFSAGERRFLQTVAQVAHLQLCELLFTKHSEFALSPREREILHWVALGKSNTVIAQLLNCSANTVDTHLRRTYAKMEVADRTTAAIKAIGLGMIS